MRLGAGIAAGNNLAGLGDVAFLRRKIFIVTFDYTFRGKPAEFFTPKKM